MDFNLGLSFIEEMAFGPGLERWLRLRQAEVGERFLR